MPVPTVVSLTAHSPRGTEFVATARPPLSWRVQTTVAPWTQDRAELELRRGREVETAVVGEDSVRVPWPFEPLSSGEEASLRVRVSGSGGMVSDWSEPLEIPGWSEPGFDDSGWRPAARRPDLVTPQARVAPPVRRFERLPVREVITSPSGRTLLDFGQNLVGRLRLEVAGPAGTVITLRHAEVLEHGELGTRPLRGAVATDRYTLRGGGVETWEPEFTFHGFRYAEVEGWPGTLDPGAITGCTRTWSGGSAATSSRSPPTARSATSAWAGPGTSRSSPRRRPSCSTAGTSWRPGWSTWPASSRLPTAWCHPSSRTFFASSVPRPRGAMPRLWCRACSMSGSVIWMCSWPSSRACGRGRTCCCAWPGSGTCGRATSSTATGSTRPPPPEYPAEAKTSQDLVATAYVFRSADLTSRAGELLGDAAAAAYYAESAAAFVGRSWPSTSRRRAG
jgi:alpha-L-rhamnosidase